jgi:hypothetical protein
MNCDIDIYNFQYGETNVMHSLSNLLRIESLYMFRALLAHLQEALHKRHLVYCVRVVCHKEFQKHYMFTVYNRHTCLGICLVSTGIPSSWSAGP